MADSRRPTRRTSQTTSSRTRRPSAHSASSASGARRAATSRGNATRPASQAQRRQASRQSAASLSRNNPNAYANSRRPTARRKASPLPFIILAAVLVLGGVGLVVHFVRNPPHFDVTINGEVQRMDRGDTIATVIEKGYASPEAGDLLAIDGSTIEAGGGHPFEATLNGEATNDPEAKLTKKSVLDISDGEDVTESSTVVEETIPHGQTSTSTDFSAYWDASLHVYEKGEDGVRTITTGDVSGKTLTEETKAPVDAGYTIYTANTGDDKVIALTFDDGPWPETTDAILDVLEANNAKATFFTIGNQIADYTEQVKREQELGCQVATHTWDHAAGSGQGVNLTFMSAEEQISEVQRGYEAITQALGSEPSHILRAPGGNFSGDIINTLEPYIDAEIGWDVDTEDWRLPGSDAIYEAIMSAKPGNVILMHDGGGDRTQTVEAISRAVPELAADGWRFVTIDELLAEYPPSTAVTSSDGAIDVG